MKVTINDMAKRDDFVGLTKNSKGYVTDAWIRITLAFTEAIPDGQQDNVRSLLLEAINQQVVE